MRAIERHVPLERGLLRGAGLVLTWARLMRARRASASAFNFVLLSAVGEPGFILGLLGLPFFAFLGRVRSSFGSRLGALVPRNAFFVVRRCRRPSSPACRCTCG